jgi:predicted exporter
VLASLGATVAPGALLALVFSAAWSGPGGAPADPDAGGEVAP